MGYHAETSGINTLNIDRLAQYLTQLAEQYNIKSWCLAFSGGVDSQVLLHLLHRTKLNLLAIYIDHGLQAESADWAKHCEQQCRQLNVSFRVISVNARPQNGEGPEAAARNARYGAFKKIIQTDMCLLTAQHQQDQAETVLLQLLRGGGAAGLAAMPQIASFAQGWHVRPLLDVSQQSILDYAQKNRLSWVEDPSNKQQSYNRNFLRLSVIPVLEQRWPALSKTLSVFSGQQAENSRLLGALADIDLQKAQIEKNRLDIRVLRKLDSARLRNALRYWFKVCGYSLPSRSVLRQIVEQMIRAVDGTGALVGWAGIEVRCFRQGLYCLKKIQHDASKVYDWSGVDSLVIESTGQTLELKQVKSTDEIPYVLTKDILNTVLSIRFRHGGERIQPAGRNGHHDLKTLFQEAGVPPWQRDKIPLLYAGDQLIAVVGYWLSDAFVVEGEGVLVVSRDLCYQGCWVQ